MRVGSIRIVLVARRKNSERVSVRSRIEGRTEQLDGRGHESVFHGSFIHYLPSISADILRVTPGMGERNSIYAVPLQGSPCGCPQTCSTMLCESWSLDGGEVAHGTQCSVHAIPTTTP